MAYKAGVLPDCDEECINFRTNKCDSCTGKCTNPNKYNIPIEEW